ncbi:MAG: universal stress protein [Sphaerochaetaceae bacterium]
MPDRAIIATDLTEASSMMVEQMGFLKEFGIAKVLLLQCPDYQDVASDAFPFIASIQAETLEQQKRGLQKAGFEVELRISPGNAKREINRIADQEGYPLVVVGSQGRSLIGGAFLGGVAHEVMLGTKKPLLIVRLGLSEEHTLQVIGISPAGVCSHILFATDFSVGSEGAFAHLLQLVSKGFVKKVTLLHVQDRSRIEPYLIDRLEEFNETDKKRLAELKQRFGGDKEVEIALKLVYGSPPLEIMRALENSDATMVLLGTQGRGFLRELFVGSVSQYVARRATVPVLLVPLC